MNKNIGTLQDALSYELQGILYAEDKVSDEFKDCCREITSPEVKAVIQAYIDNADNAKLMLNRVFNYLMIEPAPRKNQVINKMIDETQYLLRHAASRHLKDILMIDCIKNINAYKTASYQTSYLMAVELEMDTPADLIQQVLEWELNIGKSLSGLAIREFNNIEDLTFSN
jgi:ferritin-like metal-binding protein YciE